MIQLTGLSALQQFRLWVCVIPLILGSAKNEEKQLKQKRQRAEDGKTIMVLSALKKMNLEATLYDFKDHVS
jgi:hypothetical protein